MTEVSTSHIFFNLSLYRCRTSQELHVTPWVFLWLRSQQWCTTACELSLLFHWQPPTSIRSPPFRFLPWSLSDVQGFPPATLNEGCSAVIRSMLQLSTLRRAHAESPKWVKPQLSAAAASVRHLSTGFSSCFLLTLHSCLQGPCPKETAYPPVIDPASACGRTQNKTWGHDY